VVVFVKDGDINLWDSETNQSRTILRSVDVTAVTMSDDGQVIAFQRRALVDQPELLENYSLWAVDRDGGNPRELVPSATLRQRLNSETIDSVGFYQISWIPGTHRLVYSGVKYYAPGQGFTLSKDIYLVDADTRSDSVLAPDIMPGTFVNAWSFVLSPDGQQIALITGTALSFINIDGSNWRQSVLTYPQVGVGDGVLLPGGVWTRDARAFVFTRPMESASPFILNYTVLSVPVDGSPAQTLGILSNSHSGSVTFSPDGKQMAFLRDTDWFITPLAVEVGPLAIPDGVGEVFNANLHWSPGGAAYVIKDQDLFRLCPDAVRALDVCGDSIHLGENKIITSIQWVDSDRFLFTSLEPSTLSLGRLDGTLIPIVTWGENDVLSGWSFNTLR
jgi:hypothetical protein